MGNIVPMRLTTTEAKKRIALIAQDSSKLVFTHHGTQRSQQRGTTRKQVVRCLQHGIFIEPPCWDVVHGSYGFTMKTIDAGCRITVAAALHMRSNGDYIVVVTVY